MSRQWPCHEKFICKSTLPGVEPLGIARELVCSISCCAHAARLRCSSGSEFAEQSFRTSLALVPPATERTTEIAVPSPIADIQVLTQLSATNGANRFPLIPHVWTAPGCQGFSHVAAVVGAAMCPAFKRLTWPLAIMPSADQVPVKSAHSTMRWPKWVVLITGSTRSALRAVGPLQPFRHATTAQSCSSSPSLSLAPTRYRARATGSL